VTAEGNPVDLTHSIAKRAIDLQELRGPRLPDALVTMARATASMFTDSIEALADRKPDLARRVIQSDQRVDDLQKELFQWAQMEIPRHVDWTAAAIDILSVARKLERIADLSTTIAQETILLVEGTVARHVKSNDQDH
jgi:phosphate transport system protein